MLPFEPNRSLHMLSIWASVPGGTPTSIIGRMQRVIIDTFKASVLVCVIKSPTV
jgi:hypothetical protein